MSSVVITPMIIAPKNKGTEALDPLIKYAMTIPGRTAWLNASPIMLMRRSNKRFPNIPVEEATKKPVNMIQKASIL